MLAPCAFGQRLVEFSAIIGVPLADTFDTSHYSFLGAGASQGDSATRRYIAGAGLALRLPLGLGAEFDVLYQRLGYDLNGNSPGAVVAEHTWTTANSWQVPILGVYRLPRVAGLKPRISAGVSFRAVSGASTAGQCYPFASQFGQFCSSTGPVPLPADAHLADRSSCGAVFGAGIETRAGPIRFVPELRYTHWRADANSSGSFFDLRSNPDQIDFLVGINF